MEITMTIVSDSQRNLYHVALKGNVLEMHLFSVI